MPPVKRARKKVRQLALPLPPSAARKPKLVGLAKRVPTRPPLVQQLLVVRRKLAAWLVVRRKRHQKAKKRQHPFAVQVRKKAVVVSAPPSVLLRKHPSRLVVQFKLRRKLLPNTHLKPVNVAPSRQQLVRPQLFYAAEGRPEPPLKRLKVMQDEIPLPVLKNCL